MSYAGTSYECAAIRASITARRLRRGRIISSRFSGATSMSPTRPIVGFAPSSRRNVPAPAPPPPARPESPVFPAPALARRSPFPPARPPHPPAGGVLWGGAPKAYPPAAARPGPSPARGGFGRGPGPRPPRHNQFRRYGRGGATARRIHHIARSGGDVPATG